MNSKMFFRKMRRDGLTAGAMIIDGKKHNYMPPARKRHAPKMILVAFLGILAAVTVFFLSIQKPGNPARKAVSMDSAPMPVSDNERVLDLILNRENSEELESYLQQVNYIESGDEFGWTALHWAVMMKNSRAAYLLIQNGADPDARSTRDWYIFPAGSTPREIARALHFYL